MSSSERLHELPDPERRKLLQQAAAIARAQSKTASVRFDVTSLCLRPSPPPRR